MHLVMFPFSAMTSFMSATIMRLAPPHLGVFIQDLAHLQKSPLKLMMEVFSDTVLQIFHFKLEIWIILQVLNGC